LVVELVVTVTELVLADPPKADGFTTKPVLVTEVTSPIVPNPPNPRPAPPLGKLVGLLVGIPLGRVPLVTPARPWNDEVHPPEVLTIRTVAASIVVDEVLVELVPREADTQSPTLIAALVVATSSVKVVDEFQVTAVCADDDCTCAVETLIAAIWPLVPGVRFPKLDPPP
ncbi:MAG TPA: hypothetical protein VN108_05125, partial [Marmoricola sp.]|nr:hypothetical protein [Marmoricola sp.]